MSFTQFLLMAAVGMEVCGVIIAPGFVTIGMAIGVTLFVIGIWRSAGSDRR